MPIYASDAGNGDDFKLVSPGMHPAVCDMMVDLGLQEQKSQLYGDSIKHQVYIRWQIPGERLEYEKDGQKVEGPMTIGAYYTNSLSEKANLRKVLQGWRGREFTAEEAAKFDISVVLGKPCILNVIHKTGNDGKTRARIDSVGPLMKGLSAPALEGETILYDGGEESSPVWNKLRPWMQEAIKRQKEPGRESDLPELRGAEGHIPGFDADLDDDVPF
jgi:hypothetical protein